MLEKINVSIDCGAYIPERAYKTDAGLDIRSPERVWVMAHNSVIIDTGVHIELPPGYVGMLKSKSGLNVKHGLTGEGVIDSGYGGSIVVKLYNNSNVNKLIGLGDKIIQLVIIPIETPEVNLVSEINSGERGDRGFGSSGK